MKLGFGFNTKKESSASTNTLTIKDKKFKITSAVFGATLGYYESYLGEQDPNKHELRWTFDLESQFVDFVEEDNSDDPYRNATQEELFELSISDPDYIAHALKNSDENRDVAYDWKPSISSEFTIFDNMPAPYDLLGETLKVSGYDRRRQDHFFTMYVFEHTALEKNQIEFLEQKGDSFRIRWKAKCAVEWDKKYGRNLDFEVDCWIKFCGLLVVANSREEADRLVEAKAKWNLHKLPVVEKVEAEETAALGMETKAGYRYSI